MLARALLLAIGLAAAAAPAGAADNAWPNWQEGDFTIRDYAFAIGETLPELRIHYRTLGTPRRDAKGMVRNAVLVLHGTTGTGNTFLRPSFADELYGPGKPLGVTRYYLILPDDIGHGASSKPSDGLRHASRTTATTTWLRPSTGC